MVLSTNIAEFRSVSAILGNSSTKLLTMVNNIVVNAFKIVGSSEFIRFNISGTPVSNKLVIADNRLSSKPGNSGSSAENNAGIISDPKLLIRVPIPLITFSQ